MIHLCQVTEVTTDKKTYTYKRLTFGGGPPCICIIYLCLNSQDNNSWGQHNDELLAAAHNCQPKFMLCSKDQFESMLEQRVYLHLVSISKMVSEKKWL